MILSFIFLLAILVEMGGLKTSIPSVAIVLPFSGNDILMNAVTKDNITQQIIFLV